LLFLAPVAAAASLMIATPQPAQASDGMTELGVATYEVVPSQETIKVTVQISIANNSPSQVTGGNPISSYWNSTEILVPVSA
jgi:hypothetical protein